MKETKYRVVSIYQPAPVYRFMNDGDQDGDAWEGSREEAQAHVRRLKAESKDDRRWKFEIRKIREA